MRKMKRDFKMIAIALAAVLMIPLATNAAAIKADEPQQAPQYVELTVEYPAEAAPMTSIEITEQPMPGEELSSTPEERNEPGYSEGTVSGVPVNHLVFFCAGLVICIGVLVGLRLARGKKNR